MRAIKICAVRETFEEAGILLREGEGNEAWREVKEEDRRIWRDKVRIVFETVLRSVQIADAVPNLLVIRCMGTETLSLNCSRC